MTAGEAGCKQYLPQLGIRIEENNAIISVPASQILVQYRTKIMPDYISLVQYRTCSDIVTFFQSGTGLTGCRTVRHFYVYVHGPWTLTWACSIDMDMQHRHGHGHRHAAQIWSCSMDLDNGHAWMPGMPIKSSVRYHQFSVSSQWLVRHRRSGIMVSPLPLVINQSVSAQLWYLQQQMCGCVGSASGHRDSIKKRMWQGDSSETGCRWQYSSMGVNV